MKSVRVLVVDDNAGYLESARVLLEYHPRAQVVGLVRRGADGVRLTAALAPDVVLLDQTLPDMTGVAAVRAIKAGPSPPYVAIVAFSESDVDRRAAAEAGADAFIHKDRFIGDVFALIDRLASASEAGEPQV